MQSDSPTGLERSRSLHPSSLFFGLGSAAKRLLIPGIIVLVASRGNRAEIWLMIMFVPAAIMALVKYFTYRYRFGRDELVVREGVITRTERHIPYARIQNIDLVQNPLHRLFGVAEARLETASGEKPEAIMRVLSLGAVERLRERIFEGRQGRTELVEQEGDRVLVRLPFRELMTLGLLSNRGLALVAAAFGAVWQFDLFDLDEKISNFSEVQSLLPESVALPGVWRATVLAVLAVLAVVLFLKLLSLAWVAIKFYGFTLTAREENLRAEYGLLTKISASIPLNRIQLLSVKRTPLQRLLGRAAIQVETAGGRAEDEGSSVDRLWIAPLIREELVAGLLERIQPEIKLESLEWLPLAPRAPRRLLRKMLFLVALGTIGLAFPMRLWVLLPLVPAVALAFIHSRMYVKHTRYAAIEGAVFYRSGWWVRRLSVVRCNKIQALSLEESPFDRRNGMASLSVDTAGAGKTGHRIDIGYLLADAAAEMRDWLFRQTSLTAFRW
jgi:putative membrane protein